MLFICGKRTDDFLIEVAIDLSMDDPKYKA